MTMAKWLTIACTWVIALLVGALSMQAQVLLDGKMPPCDTLSDSWLLTLPQSVFGHSYSLDIKVSSEIDRLSIDGKEVKTSSVILPVISGDTSYVVSYRQAGKDVSYVLRFTYLPTLQLEGDFGEHYTLATVQLNMPETKMSETLQARVKWAGGSSKRSWFHKHSFHLKFVDSQGRKQNQQLLGLRSDNHWRLDASMNDLGRVRKHVAVQLWADFSTAPYYQAQQPSARNYVRGEYVEVFVNHKYMGIYTLEEVLDRKQLALKKAQDGTSHGHLWKAKEETQATNFVRTSAYSNSSDHWDGFWLKYPSCKDGYRDNYTVLRDAVWFVSHSTDQQFNQQVNQYFDLPVLADYYLLMQVLHAIDNSSNNLIWACYDVRQDRKLTLAVWDLDATVGQHWSNVDGCYRVAKLTPETNLTMVSKLGRSNLFYRLMRNVAFRTTVRERYWQLRSSVFHPDSLVNRYEKELNYLQTSGALIREAQRWSGNSDIAYRELDYATEYRYIADWLHRRIAYLDSTTFCQNDAYHVQFEQAELQPLVDSQKHTSHWLLCLLAMPLGVIWIIVVLIYLA